MTDHDPIEAEAKAPRSGVYRRSDGLWAWRVVARNGQITATDGGQGFSRRIDAADAYAAAREGRPVEEPEPAEEAAEASVEEPESIEEPVEPVGPYRARQALYDGPGLIIPAGAVFWTVPSDPRVRSGQAVAVPAEGPPGPMPE